MRIQNLKKFSEALRSLPRTLAIRIAERAAPELTALQRTTFDASQDAYGVPWAPSATGEKVTLKKSGDMMSTLRYVAIGTRLRIAFSVPYAKYQIGRRPAFPTQGSPLPKSYSLALMRIASEEMRNALVRGAA